MVDADTFDLETELAHNEFLTNMRNSYDPLTNTVRDVRIEDEDFTLADNVFDYALNYMGENAKTPYARQLWIMVMLCGEYCPRCAVDGMDDIENIAVDANAHEVADKLCLLTHGVCPRCDATKSGMVISGELHDYVELVGVLGQRAGKSSVVSLLITYILHRAMKMPRYAKICDNIQDFSPLTVTLVALTSSRATKLLWNPIAEILRTSNFWVDYHKMLIDSGKRYGVEFLRFNKESLYYGHKNIEIAPVGPMKRSLRGDTRLAGAVDELGWFPFANEVSEDAEGNPNDSDEEREIANAGEVYASLDNSMLTVRTEVYNLYRKGYNHIPTAMNFLISSPSSWKDAICKLLKDSEGSKLTLGVQLPTWEINPSYTRDHPFIAEAYRRNPMRAERDFGANPPQLNTLRYDKEAVLSRFTGRNHHTIMSVVSSKNKLSGRAVNMMQRADWPPTILALDAGVTNNAFALVLGTVNYEDTLAKIEVLSLGEIIPRVGMRLDFAKIYEEVISPLITECNVRYVAADRWNSIMLLDQVEVDHRGTSSITYSLKRKDFDQFDTEMIDNGNLTLPSLEIPADVAEATSDYKKGFIKKPAAHLYLQFLTVKELGGTIVKGDGYTDDMYRALQLLGAVARKPKVAERLRRFPSKRRAGISEQAQVLIGSRGFSGINSIRI